MPSEEELAVRLDSLPSTTLPIFNGGAPPVQGEHCAASPVENVPALQSAGLMVPVVQYWPAVQSGQSVPAS